MEEEDISVEEESPFNQYRIKYCANCPKGKTPKGFDSKNISASEIWKCAIVRLSLNGDK